MRTRHDNGSSTKKGPGRLHCNGVKKAPRLKNTGAFSGQHTNERARARRAVKAAIGARQYRKVRKAMALAGHEVVR